MIKFTFDTNCLIDLDEKRPEAEFLWRIIDASTSGTVKAAFVAVSASERQPGDCFLETYGDFTQRLERLGVDDLPQIPGMAYTERSYIGHALLPSDEQLKREQQLHEALFPNIAFDSSDHVALALKRGETEEKARKKWCNAWCDRQMIWSHEYHGRDVFVTGDGNFSKKLSGRAGFEHLRIMKPKEAVSLLP